MKSAPIGSNRLRQARFTLAPLQQALAWLVAAGSLSAPMVSHAQVQGAWFAQGNSQQFQQHSQAARQHAARAAHQGPDTAQQRTAARAQLAQSLDNLNRTAHAIAAQQAAQNAARLAAQQQASDVADGLAQGGLEVATGDNAQWLGAGAPVHTVQNGQHHVGIKQTEPKAILNWNRFDVGRNTTVEFQQKSSDAVLNRVVGDQVAPSQIQGAIKGDGTVMVVNQNGVVFSGTSQVNVRNLVAAAANITDTQFNNNGLYGKDGQATFTDASGKIQVQAGAQIRTHEPASVTQGGGYVLLVGGEVNNAGSITTPKGQTQLAAGDNFIIRKGVGTDANTASTTRGNEIAPQFETDSQGGKVSNSGLIVSREGDITLAGRNVQQNGVAVSTTTVNQRGTVHLLNSISDEHGQITLGQHAMTAILIDDDGNTSALDSQRDALIKESSEKDVLRSEGASGFFDNLSILADRRDQSRIEIVSGGNIVFDGDSLTLATGGQIVANAIKRSFVADGARLDVAGAVGVNVAMASNNVKVNVQGFELRDAPLNRDSGKLFNNDVWLDRRQLVLVAKGTGGYEDDRWYTANGLLEVGGYLGTQSHSIGEWAAQGGTVLLSGGEVVSQAGSAINIAGGTLDVAAGYLNQSWLRGSDGRLYSLDKAPADMVFGGIYKGYEAHHARWNIIKTYSNPLIAPQKRLENGYTVGRDAGRLIISVPTAMLEGNIEASVVNSVRQRRGQDQLGDGYKQAQTASARAGTLVVAIPRTNFSMMGAEWDKLATDVLISVTPQSVARSGTIGINADLLNSFHLGGLTVVANNITLEDPVALAVGGRFDLVGEQHIDVHSELSARGGRVSLRSTNNPMYRQGDTLSGTIVLHEGAKIDTRGVWTNLLDSPSDTAGLAFQNGGEVFIRAANIKLETGSRIDATAGASLTADGKFRGARGGDISLLATEMLVLGGEVLSHGFARGGKLNIQSGGIQIIEHPATVDGRVAFRAGESIDLERLRLDENLTIDAGKRLPFDYTWVVETRLAPGEIVPAQGYELNPVSPIAVPHDWTVPEGGYAVSANWGWYADGYLVPAGTLLRQIYIPGGAPLPAQLFPNGVSLGIQTYRRAAGETAPHQVTFDVGWQVPIGTTFDRPIVLASSVIELAPGFFSQGFSNYSLTGLHGISVEPGLAVDVQQPVLLPADSSQERAQSQSTWDVVRTTKTGADIASLFVLDLPPIYLDDTYKGTTTRRDGASVELRAGVGLDTPRTEFLTAGPRTGGQAAVRIGQAASLRVDPGATIVLRSDRDIQVDGRLTAHGGRIVLDVPFSESGTIALGETAVLDTSARAHTGTDVTGRRWGVVPDGGSILIGGSGAYNKTYGQYDSTKAAIKVAAGALLDVSGTLGTLTLTNNGVPHDVVVASDGGSIAFNTWHPTLTIEGELRAFGGGEGAAGGSLKVIREAAIRMGSGYDGGSTILVIGQDIDSNTHARPEDWTLTAGQIQDGGFDDVKLFARSTVLFDGDVSFSTGRSLEISAQQIANRVASGTVDIVAPYVLLSGAIKDFTNTNGPYSAPNNILTAVSGERLSFHAGLVDIRSLNQTGFTLTDFRSSGDIRFGTGSFGTSASNAVPNKQLRFTAVQIYPTTGADARINVDGSGSAIVIDSVGGDVPALPHSVFGQIRLNAERIVQGGVLRAPLGGIQLQSRMYDNAADQSIRLLDGSITSISAAGLTTFYGGTADGVNFTVDGELPYLANLYTGISGDGDYNQPSIALSLRSPTIDVAKGAMIDVSGGGDLHSAAFLSGRGGSVDALLHPRQAGGQVFAIAPNSPVAPGADAASQKWTGDVPRAGQQITIPAGVSGLAAGTYMLLPAYYALLPGAFRVELGGQTTQSVAGVQVTPDGSYRVSALGSIANTTIRDTLATNVLVTSGKTLRTWSQYNEQSYAQLAVANASLNGTTRPLLPGDGKFLHIANLHNAKDISPEFSFEGKADFTALEGYFPGSLIIDGVGWGDELVIARDDSDVVRQPGTLVLPVSVLDRIGASNLYLGSAPTNLTIGNPSMGQPIVDQPHILFGEEESGINKITLESGVTLKGSHIVFYSAAGANGQEGKIILQEGATISTLGQGMTAPDASYGYQYLQQSIPQGGRRSQSGSMLVVSNGRIDLASPPGSSASSIVIGDGAKLYSEGTIAFHADRGVDFVGTPSIGARYLALSLPSINLGTEAALNAAQLAGTLPAGLRLTQRTLDILLNGNSAIGAPMAQSLSLSAADAIHVFGSFLIDTVDTATGASRLGELGLNSPAIYGHGAAGDEALFRTGKLVWNGVSRPTIGGDGSSIVLASAVPGAIDPATLGAGRLAFEVDEFVLGYPQHSMPDARVSLDRLALGFSNVDIRASHRIIANNKGTLSVYQTGPNPGTEFNADSYAGVGGALSLVTPLFSTAGGAIIDLHAGGVLRVVSPDGSPAAFRAPDVGFGGDLGLSGHSVHVDSMLAAPSGRIRINAVGDIVLGERSWLDAGGRTISFFEQDRYTWGGDVVLESAQGDIVQHEGGKIDVAAANQDAGRIQLTAAHAASGAVLLGGTLLGESGVGKSGGSLTVRAQRIGADVAHLSADFALLNTYLSETGFTEARHFQLKQGSLVIGNEVRAHEVVISVDGGSLTVDGRIDASGTRPGSIRLAAHGDLTLTGMAVLDTHGTVLQVDSYAQAIEAKNRGHVELTSAEGWLRLQPGASIDVSAPGAAWGKVELNTGRTGETSGDVRVDAAGPVHISGAISIALNAFWSYSPTDADGSILQNNGDTTPVGSDGVVGLDQIDVRNTQFMDAASGNTGLGARTAGLRNYGAAYHLRPGVEINASATPNGRLTVKGDLDLSTYRYGSGEALTLWVRAAGDLTVNGSISDGFMPTLPAKDVTYSVIADVATNPIFWKALEFEDISYDDYIIHYFWRTDVPVTLVKDWTVPVAFYGRGAPAYSGRQEWAAGSTIPAGTELTQLKVPFGFVASVEGVFKTLLSPATAPVPGGMLAAGTQSASIRLVSGADAAAADGRMLQAHSKLGGQGHLVLDDKRLNPTFDGQELVSVIRTGTGYLDLIAGGNYTQNSLYGVYTAGTATHLPSDDALPLLSFDVWYPDHGGDLRLEAQGTLSGYHGYDAFGSTGSHYVHDWFVTSRNVGASALGTNWGINFGRVFNASKPWPHSGRYQSVVGFIGVGTLGGGNATVIAGRDAGNVNSPYYPPGGAVLTSQALTFAVGSTGRVTAIEQTDGVLSGGTLVQTGGGDLIVRIGGRFNPGDFKSEVADGSGTFMASRGVFNFRAQSLGTILKQAGSLLNDQRLPDFIRPTIGTGVGGPVLVLGDAVATFRTGGDLALGGVGDPGLLGKTPILLQTADSAIELFSTGGNVSPYTAYSELSKNATRSKSFLLPPQLRVVANGGSIYNATIGGNAQSSAKSIELLPSPKGQLELLARNSIYSSGRSFLVSSVPTDVGSLFGPFNARDYTGTQDLLRTDYSTRPAQLTNLHVGEGEPIRAYAVEGDIVNLGLGQKIFGESWSPGGSVKFTAGYTGAAKPAWVLAGRDIVQMGGLVLQPNLLVSPAVLLHNHETDISRIAAGRDILGANIEVAGPGTLEVTAGRNLYQRDKGSLLSTGGIVEGDTRPGASIVVQIGAGAAGPDWAALASRYLNPANLADDTPGHPLADQPGKVAKTYETELLTWLEDRYGFEADSPASSLAYFSALAPEQQRVFLRRVYYAELKAGGREYNDVSGARLGSYLRGRQMIATLFPEQDAHGEAILRGGDLTQFGASGIRTLFGGDIQLLAPAGRIVVGVQGEVPPATSGLVTQGDGNIELYSEGSVLLGLSRVMTTFGGDILAWSAKGDINAGRGSKTTLVYTPPKRVYDAYGNVALSPDVPSSGAGIATLNPIAEVKPGDIDLIAPLGTIDTGEAGIRVSGSVNIAALHVVNVENIEVQGESKGIPMAATVNVGALTSASSAATSAATAAQETIARARSEARSSQPSQIQVQVLGFGSDTSALPVPTQVTSAREPARYDAKSVVQVVGEYSQLYPQQAHLLNDSQRRLLSTP